MLQAFFINICNVCAVKISGRHFNRIFSRLPSVVRVLLEHNGTFIYIRTADLTLLFKYQNLIEMSTPDC